MRRSQNAERRLQASPDFQDSIHHHLCVSESLPTNQLLPDGWLSQRQSEWSVKIGGSCRMSSSILLRLAYSMRPIVSFVGRNVRFPEDILLQSRVRDSRSLGRRIMPQAPFTSILNTDVYSSSDVTRIPCFSRQSWITCWHDSDSDSGMSRRNRAPSGRHFFKPRDRPRSITKCCFR